MTRRESPSRPSACAAPRSWPILDLDSAREHDVELAVAFGAVTLTLPADLVVSENAVCTVESKVSVPGGVEFFQHKGFRGRVLELAHVPVGRLRLVVKVLDPDAPRTEEELPGGGTRFSTAASYETVLEVEVVPGGRAFVGMQ